MINEKMRSRICFNMHVFESIVQDESCLTCMSHEGENQPNAELMSRVVDAVVSKQPNSLNSRLVLFAPNTTIGLSQALLLL